MNRVSKLSKNATGRARLYGDITCGRIKRMGSPSMNSSIYLDHNATTPLLPEVLKAMREVWAEGPANPASTHSYGRRARRQLEDARESIGQALGAEIDRFDGDRLIFTSGGTESNQLALHGLVVPTPPVPAPRVLISTIEHPSLVGAAMQLAERGAIVDRLPVDRHGVVEIERLDDLLRPETRLVSVMAANNETGVVQPLEAIIARCATGGVAVHSDASQLVGKLPIHFGQLGLTAMTFTAHKLHGPVGIGALIVRRGVELRPLWQGGFQQAGLRPGTEALALVVGFGKAVELWQREQRQRQQRMGELRDRFEAQLLAEWPNIVVHGRDALRTPHTSCLGFPWVDRQALVVALDLAGVACSTGSACASGSSEPSPVLLAMGVSRNVVQGSLRFSLGSTTTAAEVDLAVAKITATLRTFGR